MKVDYKEDTKTFDIWNRPLWDWAVDQLQNPLLIDHFVWDAQRLSKFNGSKFVRFLDEPWTADRFWDIQVCRRGQIFSEKC